jgi:hypothetical protein
MKVDKSPQVDLPFPAVGDSEGDVVPSDLPGIIDTHVHIMYGSDFPSIPYAWDREIKQIKKARLSRAAMTKIFRDNALQFFNLEHLQKS